MEELSRPGMGQRSTTLLADQENAYHKSENILLKRKYERLLKKEKRIQVSLFWCFHG